MKKQKISNSNKKFILKTYACLGLCLVFIASLFFSTFFEKLLNNTWALYESDITSSSFKMHFIDVGQGDCSFIQVGDKSVLIDTGTEDRAQDVIRYLNYLGFNKNDKIDYLILTHTDIDHVGGTIKLLNEFEILNIYIPKIYSNYEVEQGVNVNDYNIDDSFIWDKISRAIHNEVNNEHLFYNFKGEKIKINNFSFDFYMPIKDNFNYSNSYSPIIVFGDSEFKAMFVGDCSYVEEYSFLNTYSSLVDENFFDCDVLKVGHHGSKDSTTELFLEAIKPEFAVISVGENNYGHPTEEVLTRLEDVGSEALRTDLTGSIVLFKQGEDVKYKTNFKFFGTTYFKWWYFVVTFILLSILTTFCFNKKSFNRL